MRKRICQKQAASTKFTCGLCGQTFSTRYGLDYHAKNAVCYSQEGNAQSDTGCYSAASPIVVSSGDNSPVPQPAVQLPPAKNQPSAGPPPNTLTQNSNGVGQAMVPDFSSRMPAPQASNQRFIAPVTPAHGPTRATGPDHPYAHLTPQKLKDLNIQLQEAEEVYSERMRQAQLEIANPFELKVRMDSLKNSLATKQSMIRKKYGVKLRTRRNRHEIMEDRARALGATPGSAPTPDSVGMHQSKKARVSEKGDAIPTQVDYPSSQQTPTRKPVGADVAALTAAAAAAERVNLTVAAAPAPVPSSAPAAPPTTVAALPTQAPLTQQPRHQSPPRRDSNLNQVLHSATPKRERAENTVVATPASFKRTGRPLHAQQGVESGSNSESDSDVDVIPAQLPPPPDRSRFAVPPPSGN